MRTRPPGTLSVVRWPQRYRDDPFVWTVVRWQSGPVAYVRLRGPYAQQHEAEAALFRLAQADADKGLVA